MLYNAFRENRDTSFPNSLQEEEILRGFGTLGLRVLEIGLRNNEYVAPSRTQLHEWQTAAE